MEDKQGAAKKKLVSLLLLEKQAIFGGFDALDIPNPELDFSNLKLSTIPHDIFHSKYVEKLNLDHNNITSLPYEIGRFPKLRWLTLDDNLLTSFPPGLCKGLEKLTCLVLSNNKLTSLPPEIGKLSSLITLVLDGNALESLPAEIGQLSQLQTLTLENNKLVSLPVALGNLSSLKEFNLKGNPLRTPPKSITARGARDIGNYYYFLSQISLCLPSFLHISWVSERPGVRSRAMQPVQINVCGSRYAVISLVYI